MNNTSMNCFDWNSHSSDYLDGTLMGQQKRDADQHLESCAACQKRFSHYRQLLNTLKTQPRAELLHSADSPAWYKQTLRWLKAHPNKTRSTTPWFIRGSVEGIGMAAALLILVAAVPKLKNIYDNQRQKRLEAFFEPANPPVANRVDAPPLARGQTDVLESEFETDEASDSPTQEESAPTTGSVPSRPGEIWRFGIKTPSPKEMRPLILKALSSLAAEFPAGKQGGLEAPGGIQFEAWIPSDRTLALKEKLQALADQYAARPGSEEQATTDDNDSEKLPDNAPLNTHNAHFTWYKNRSKKLVAGPAGKTRVIIWLSQI